MSILLYQKTLVSTLRNLTAWRLERGCINIHHIDNYCQIVVILDMLKKPKWIKPSSIKTYIDALRALKMIKEGKKRAEKTAYEAILTQVFQKWVRTQGDCVLRNIPKSWTCSDAITAGHVFSRAIKELKWDTRNCYPQCDACNNMHQYYPFVFEDWCKQKLGDQEYESMKEVARKREYFEIPFDEVINRINLWLSLLPTVTSG